MVGTHQQELLHLILFLFDSVWMDAALKDIRRD